MADTTYLGHVCPSSQGTAITLPPEVQNLLGVGGGADVHYAIVAGVVTVTGGTPATQPADAPLAPTAAPPPALDVNQATADTVASAAPDVATPASA